MKVSSRITIGTDRRYLFGAIRYRAIGSVTTLDVFGWQAYASVGSVRWIAGFVFGRDKAGE